MQCSDAGAEVFVFLLVTSALVGLLVFRPRAFQRWLRARRNPRSIWPLPVSLLEPEQAWMFRAVGLIPLLMWVVAVAGAYCFFHGPDLPPVSR
jgi:hypothetical protein